MNHGYTVSIATAVDFCTTRTRFQRFVFAKDRQGRFTLVNQAVADAYGTSVERLIGKTDADFNANVDELAGFRKGYAAARERPD